MHDHQQDAYVYAILWLIGAAASLARSLNDPNYRSSWRVFGAITCGGFLALVAVGLLVENRTGSSSASSNIGYSLGLASLFGLLGKDCDQVLRWITNKLSAGKMQLPEPKKDDEPK